MERIELSAHQFLANKFKFSLFIIYIKKNNVHLML